MSLKSFKWIYFTVILTLCAGLGVAGGLGCSESGGIQPINPTASPTPIPTITPIPPASPTPSPTPIADLAMGDIGSDNVYIYFDVIPAPSPSPNVILDNGTSEIDNPVAVKIEDDRLFVANQDTDEILIFDGFSSLTAAPTPSPSVKLDNGTSEVDVPEDIAVAPGLASFDLYVANSGSDTVTIYRNIDAVGPGDPTPSPDVTLNNADSDIDNPQSLVVVNNILYVCNDDDDTVTIYNNADSLAPTTPTPNPNPDVTLDSGGSGIDACVDLGVFDNVLYVVNRPSNDFFLFEDTVTAYSPADGLSDGDPPDFTLEGFGNSIVQVPNSVYADDGRLFVTRDPSITDFGVVAFDDPILDNQPPDVLLVDPTTNCYGIDGALGAVFMACDPSDGIFGYLDSGAVTSGALPDITRTDASMSAPDSLDVQVRP